MKRHAFVVIAALTLLSACADDPQIPRVTTEPMPAPLRMNAVSGGATGSTICNGYTKDLAVAQEELKATPEDGERQQKVASLDAMVADACN